MYFYNIKLLDLKKKGKKKNLLNSSKKKNERYQVSNPVHLLQKLHVSAMCYKDNYSLLGKF